MPRVVIIGAGISGLALAYRLQQQIPQAEITVLEQRRRAGGTVGTVARDGFRVETGPNGFLDTKPSTLELCKELRLADRLVAADDAAVKKRYLFLGGQLKPLPTSPLSFLRSDLLSWRGKVSLLMELFRKRSDSSEDESISDFVRRRAGGEAAAVLADALVTGIYAGDPSLLSMKACFPRIVQLEQEHGSVLKGMAAAAKKRRAEARARGEAYVRPGKLWSFDEGLALLIETLVQRLRNPPTLGAAATEISETTGAARTWRVSAADGRAWEADAVALTCPAYRQAEIVATFDPDLSADMAAIAYNRVAVVALGYRKQDVPMAVDGFGFIAPQHTRRDVLGVQWCSSLFPGRAPANAVLLRALCGGWHRGEMVSWDDDRLLAAVRGELRQAMGITAAPLFTHIMRWEHAIPQYHVGHLERVRRIEDRAARYPGLFVGGNAYHGVALNDCTEQAQLLARRIADHLQIPKT